MVTQGLSTKDCGDWWDVRDLSYRLERIIDSMAKSEDLAPHLYTVVSFVSGLTDQEGIECLVTACQRKCSSKVEESSASQPVGLFEAIPHLLLKRPSKSLIEFHDRLTRENLVGFYALVWLVTVLEGVIQGDRVKVDSLVAMSEQVCGDLRPVLTVIRSINLSAYSVRANPYTVTDRYRAGSSSSQLAC